MCVCVFSSSFSDTTGSAEAKFHVEGKKVYSNGPGHLLFYIIANLRGGGGGGPLAGILPQICPRSAGRLAGL